MYESSATVEGVRAVRCESVPRAWAAGDPVVLEDPKATSVAALGPMVVVDAIIAKRNLGTNLGMAPVGRGTARLLGM